MSSFPCSELTLLQECYLERQALSVCRSATFLGCLQTRNIAESVMVRLPKGKTVAVRASQISGTRAKFFARITLEPDRCLLTHRGEELVDLYLQWLVQEYTERYRHLKTAEHQHWLTQVVTLVVCRALMEQKYHWATTQGILAFADAWAYQEMARLHLLHTLPGDIARLVHHVVRDPEHQHDLLAAFWTELDVRLQGPHLCFPDPLPPLPGGTLSPFPELTLPEEETHG